MKSKKPFLIVCAAALTLAVALPFMGVFAFADDVPLEFYVHNSNSSNVSIYVNNDQKIISANLSISVDIVDSAVNLYGTFTTGGNTFFYKFYTDSSFSTLASSDSSNPTVLNPGDTLYISKDYGTLTNTRYYVFLQTPVPPDPLAPVSDGMDTMISVFGDVIDYIINTPDVSIFVAISVASCAIISMGIILIKKLIKGY